MRMIILGLIYLCCGPVFAQERSMGTIVPVKDSITNLGNPTTRKEAVKELRKTGYPAFKELRSLAKNTSKGRDERIAAVLLTGEIVTSTAAAASDREGFRKDAETMLSSDKDDFVREASAIALGKLEDKNALKSLKSALNDKSGNVRMRAAWALAKNGDYSGKEAALQMLDSDDASGQAVAIEALEEIEDNSLIPELEKRLKAQNPGTRISAILAIKRVKLKSLSAEKRITFFAESLTDKQAEVVQWAAKKLTAEIENDRPQKYLALKSLKTFSADKSNSRHYLGIKWLNYLVEKGKISEEEMYK